MVRTRLPAASPAWTRRTAGPGRVAPLARSARASGRDAARRRPDRRAAARQARPPHRRRPARRTGRAATSSPIAERRSRDLFGDEEAVIEGVVRTRVASRAAAGCTSSRHTSRTTPARSGRRGSTSRGSRRSWLPARACACAASRIATASRSIATTSARTPETADFAPVYPASEELAQKQLRGLVEAALDRRACGGRAAAGVLAASRAAAASRRRARRRSIARARSTRPRRDGAGSPSTSCSCSSSRSHAARPSARLLVAEALPRPASSPCATASVLPFTLTDAQEQAIAEIDADLARTTPMQRLLQGDVGSGKTVVALYALLRAVEAGRQGALMAPTEVLAEQHFLTIEGDLHGARRARRAADERPRRQGARDVRQLVASGDVADRSSARTR